MICAALFLFPTALGSPELLDGKRMTGEHAPMAKGKPWLRWRMLPVTLYSLLLAVWLVPASGAYQIPVAIYLLCLYAMAFTACRVEDKTGLLWLGAMPFAYAAPVIGYLLYGADVDWVGGFKVEGAKGFCRLGCECCCLDRLLSAKSGQSRQAVRAKSRRLQRIDCENSM